MENRMSALRSLDPDNPALAHKVRVRFRRRVLWIVGALMVVGVISGLVGFLSGPDGWLWVPVAQPTLGMKIIGRVLMLGGVGLEVGVLLNVIRTGRARRNIRSPLWALSRSQRRSLRSQVMRNVIEPGTDPAAVRLAATSMADQLWVIWMMAGLATSAAGQVLASPSRLMAASATVVASCSGAAVVLALRQTNRADRFLHDHLPADVSRDATTTDDPHR
jgi:hypothetical protein